MSKRHYKYSIYLFAVTLILILWENVIRHNGSTLPRIAPLFLSYVRLSDLF